MTIRIALQPCYVLHQRPYRETSVLLDVLTAEHGRLSLVARGVRQQRSRWRALLQPFVSLLITYQGKGELMSLYAAEMNGVGLRLQGDCLLSGLYLNELMSRLLPKNDPHPSLYTIYQHTLLELANNRLEEKSLRLFEKKLLEELGYGLHLSQDFLPDKRYQFYPDQGFLPYTGDLLVSSNVFSGQSLLALAGEQLDEPSILQDVKRLMRLALWPLLGERPLNSRRLFNMYI